MVKILLSKDLNAYPGSGYRPDFIELLPRIIRIGRPSVASKWSISRRFSLNDQKLFSELSGDRNPIHIDPIESRRSTVGKPVVHGVHSVLWTLEEAAKYLASAENLRFSAIRAVFLQPLTIETEVTCDFQIANERITAAIEAGDRICARIEAMLGNELPQTWDALWSKTGQPDMSSPNQDLAFAKELSFEEASKAKGTVALLNQREKTAHFFPNLLKRANCSSFEIDSILAVSKLVGMHCPGRHSLLSALDLELRFDTKALPDLQFLIRESDDRFQFLVIGIHNKYLSGSVRVFLRPGPVSQPSFKTVKQQPLQMVLTGRKVLIVGGSRGLGEIAAKVASAAGAEVALTYRLGKADAEKIAAEINQGGPKTYTLAYDALDTADKLSLQLQKLNWLPTDLYYFATPAIFIEPYGWFSETLFQNFCLYYVTGFIRTVYAVHSLVREPLTILNPSSVAVETNPKNMGAYSAAKSASESAGGYLMRTLRDVHVYSPRLPQTMTDQTTTIMKAARVSDRVSEPLEVIRQALSQLYGLRRGV